MEQVVRDEKEIKREVTNLIDKNRIVNFSDAVFAFAATLLVLKIDLPQMTGASIDAQFLAAIPSLLPQYLANIISFFVIGYYWLNHHMIFAHLKKFNMTIVWMNIFFLILVSFLPFPVDLYGSYINVPSIVMFYSASLALVGFMLFGIWLYAVHKNRLIEHTLGKKEIAYYSARTLIAPVVFSLSIPLVAIHPLVAQFFWILVIVGIVFLNKFFHSHSVSTIKKTMI